MVDMNYANIDMVRTGKLLRYYIFRQKYTVRQMQKELVLGSPQPIYRWFQGKILPSVEHLFKLSRILEVHMETLLVEQRDCRVKRVYHADAKEREHMERVWLYYEILRRRISIS